MKREDLLALTSDIVASHLSNNSVPVTELPKLIEDVFGALNAIDGGADAAQKPQPAVPINKSITPDYLICLEDGKKLKMLKRYLMTQYGMTPQEYRERWNLAPDYPMVAPNYAKQRRELAKKIGLGRKRSG